MSEPTPEEIARAFGEDRLPRLPPQNPGISGNVICAVCIIEWTDSGHFWQGEPIHIVAVYKGASVCIKHLREQLEKDRG